MFELNLTHLQLYKVIKDSGIRIYENGIDTVVMDEEIETSYKDHSRIRLSAEGIFDLIRDGETIIYSEGFDEKRIEKGKVRLVRREF